MGRLLHHSSLHQRGPFVLLSPAQLSPEAGSEKGKARAPTGPKGYGLWRFAIRHSRGVAPTAVLKAAVK